MCFSKVPVNTVQCRVAFVFEIANNSPKYDQNYISLLFYIFLITFLFSKSYVSKISTKLYISIFLLSNILLGVLAWLCGCLIIFSSDAELNPGPKNNFSEYLSICHWNRNSISAQDYSKLFLLKAFFIYLFITLFNFGTLK